MICKKCTNEIPELNFPEEQLLETRGLVAHGLKLFLVRKLLEQGVSHRDSKLIADHLNPKIGHCNQCDFDELKGENAECPECGSFNYNLKELPFNEAFCSRLEWSLDFDNLGVEEVKGFWCDGISAFPPDMKSLSKAAIQQNRQIITEARIGKGGQDKYELTIQLGPKALDYYERDLDLTACIPDSDHRYWISIDVEEQEVCVRLD